MKFCDSFSSRLSITAVRKTVSKQMYSRQMFQRSVEQYYNTVIVIDYQLQIPLHFGSTAKTEPCEYHFNLLTQSL